MTDSIANQFLRLMDITYFGGPLLSLFENFKNNNLFLFDWVDADDTSNRWMIYRTTPDTLQKFISKEISRKDLFMSNDLKCYFVDIDDELNWHNYQVFDKTQIPSIYVPKNHILFNVTDCPNISQLQEFVKAKMMRRRVG